MERTCSITGAIVTDKDGVMWMQLRPGLQEFVKTIHNGIDAGSFISYKALNEVLHAYVANLTAEETKAHSALMHNVSKQYEEDKTLQPIEARTDDKQLSFGERLSDKIADFGGSWRFFVFDEQGFRPLPLYLAQPHAFLCCGIAGTANHDEPKPPRRQRQRTCRIRLQGESES
jgi:hypothetical protein